MDTSSREYERLRAAVSERMNAHDLLGLMDLGAPDDEYDPEMRDFVRLIAEGVTITPEVVATVWHKWFGTSDGDPARDAQPATPGMEALAADLQAIQEDSDLNPS